jgi:hypothetical protein
MLKTSKIVFVGNGNAVYALKSGVREIFEKNIPKEVGKEDAVILLRARGSKCDCHKQPAVKLFLTYDEWKEVNK